MRPECASIYLDGLYKRAHGALQVVIVDDYFPVTVATADPSNPFESERAGLAYSRGAQGQLWVSLVEKAYASHCRLIKEGREI